MDNIPNLIHYKIFEPYKNLFAFTTTKQTLTSTNPRFTGDSNEIFSLNRKMLAEKIGIDQAQLVFPRQTHTDCVSAVSEIPENEITETDALVTTLNNICICVQTADCVPILLHEPTKKVIAVVHAGWRGTVKKILANTIQKMIVDYEASPHEIIAAIGPSIGPEIYEVGNEVVQSVKHAFPEYSELLKKKASGKFHFNLWEANRRILMKNNVLPKNIETLEECSFELNQKYFSARKEGVETGRMVSGIMLKF